MRSYAEAMARVSTAMNPSSLPGESAPGDILASIFLGERSRFFAKRSCCGIVWINPCIAQLYFCLVPCRSTLFAFC